MLQDLQMEVELENSPGEKRQLDRSQSLGHLCRSDGNPLVPTVGGLLHEGSEQLGGGIKTRSKIREFFLTSPQFPGYSAIW